MQVTIATAAPNGEIRQSARNPNARKMYLRMVFMGLSVKEGAEKRIESGVLDGSRLVRNDRSLARWS